MQTRHPKVLFNINVPYAPRNKNAQLDHYEIHKKVNLTHDQFFVDFRVDEPLSVLSRTLQINTFQHLLLMAFSFFPRILSYFFKQPKKISYG